MSPPWLPFHSVLADPPTIGSPPCPPILAAALEVAALWPSSSRDVCPTVGMFVREQLILVPKRCGCRAGLAGWAHEWYPMQMLRL